MQRTLMGDEQQENPEGKKAGQGSRNRVSTYEHRKSRWYGRHASMNRTKAVSNAKA